MKYLIFGCYTFYPSGGMADFKVSRDSKEDAEAYVKELETDGDYNFVQIFCVEEKELIQYNFGGRGTMKSEYKVTEQGVVKK